MDRQVVGEIGAGVCVLLGVSTSDDDERARRLAGKVARLRIFENEEGKFDKSLLDTGGAALVVSQFTLIADTAKGNRPSFTDAAPPERTEPLYEVFCAIIERKPVDDYAHFALGRCLEKHGRREEAVGHYRMASVFVPQSQTYTCRRPL